MWKNLKIGLTIGFIMCALPFCSYASSGGVGSSTQRSGQNMTISMSITQWESLKQELSKQNLELEQLRQKLKMLKSTSSEQMKLLENLQNELNATRQSLMNANVSLTECRNELEKSKASLETLKQEIKQMEHKQVVLRRQRDVWAAIAALSVGAVIARR